MEMLICVSNITIILVKYQKEEKVKNIHQNQVLRSARSDILQTRHMDILVFPLGGWGGTLCHIWYILSLTLANDKINLENFDQSLKEQFYLRINRTTSASANVSPSTLKTLAILSTNNDVTLILPMPPISLCEMPKPVS